MTNLAGGASLPTTNLADRDRAVIWHPYTQMKTAPLPVPIARAEGVYLYTEDGRRLLDGISSWWVNIHGHGRPEIADAIARQAAKLEHVLFAGFTHEPAIELAERLTAVLPAGLSRIFYSDNGSTAVEVALKMAYQYWRNRGQPGRREFVALHHAYHGDTVGAMSSSAASVFTSAFEPLLFSVHRAEAPYCYRCPLGLERPSCKIACLESLERILESRQDAIAALIVEPMLQGAGGMIVWPEQFLAGARRLCDQYGVLLIADEVLTGFGRTGTMFACEHASISPDIMCLSKALTGGYLPMGVTAATEQIYEAFLADDRSKTFFHGHSYTANPLACAAAIASLDLFERDNSLRRVKMLEQQLTAGLDKLRRLEMVGNVRVIGGVGAVELVMPDALARRFAPPSPAPAGEGYLHTIGPALYKAFLERGLLVRPLGHILYLMPPYVITADEVTWAIAQIEELLLSWEAS
jgi:adenosylmethionine-8-amino-7-oxononanoate aminotransferase